MGFLIYLRCISVYGIIKLCLGTVNAKNRFGGYVGAKPYYAMIHNGKIVTLISTPRTIPDSVKLGLMAGLLEKEFYALLQS